MSKSIVILILMLFLSSCFERMDKEGKQSADLCSQYSEDTIEILKGTLNINSKGKFIFNDLKYRDSWQQKTQLIPCSEDLKKYIEGSYDAYLNLRNFDEDFWVFLEGEYIASDTIDRLPEFLFSFVALIDEMEAITDSSQALRQIAREKRDSLSKTKSSKE